MAHNESPNPSKTISLDVKEMYALGRRHGVARLHRDLISAMGLRNGDIIELRGRRRTYAKVHELYPTDQEKDIIRLDEIQRANVAVGVGAKVSAMPVSKKIPTAESVIIALLSRNIMPRNIMPSILDTYVASQLVSIPVTEGDLLVIWHFLESVVFKVVKVRPVSANSSYAIGDGIAIISKDTKLTIQEMPAEAQQMIKYESVQAKARKGPINLSVIAYGVIDATRESEETSPASANERIVILTLELKLYTARFVNTTRTFRRLIPPNEKAATIIEMCMNSAAKIVDEANSTLSSSAEDGISNDNYSKMNQLVQLVFNTASRIISRWIVIGEEGTGGGSVSTN